MPLTHAMTSGATALHGFGLPHPGALFPLLIGFRANNVAGLSGR